MSQWRIRIDQSICVGSGTCTSIAPDLFQLDEDDRSCPPAGALPAQPRLIEAAELCPTGAIDVVDAETGESQID
ncbi:ferredoxin [Saccharopolyspora shandongensis]|uniref:ferredoxin n=1 Tax=Saccharopolyspora shandongensis TaxID=418495 RepID=UPI00343D6B35